MTSRFDLALSKIKKINKRKSDSGLVWQFAGQGTLRVGVARDLYESEEAFRLALSRCDDILLRRIGITLSGLLYPDLKGQATSTEVAEALLLETRYAQPALVALEYCISEVWTSKGIRPSMVIGHSIGEYAAAVVAGVLSIDDCLHLVCDRGQQMYESAGCKGCMVAIRATEHNVIQAIEDMQASLEVSIAAVNGTMSLVLSGSEEAVDRVLSSSKLSGAMNRKLNVNHAFHSPLTECMLDKFRQSFDSVQLKEPLVQMVSTVRGQIVSKDIACVDYWIDHVRQTVLYSQAIEQCWAMGGRVYVEFGVDQSLTEELNYLLDCKKNDTDEVVSFSFLSN